jgi:biopolymer transport protein ExbD
VKLRRRPPRKARIEIIPMIDTVFFLLVFFMMASLAMTVHGGIPVNLPKAARAEGRVVDVMDAARLAGVGKLAIAVTPRETRR